MKWLDVRIALFVLVALAAAPPVRAHITPPVVLVSDRDAVVGLLSGARRFFVREVRLTPEQRQAIEKQWGWRPEEDFHRFYVGRDEQGRLVAATIFMTEYTIHGPVRVAVGIGPDGRIKGATVVELTEETYPWVKPLLDENFARVYVGRDSRAAFAMEARGADINPMARFYGQIIATLMQRAVVLWEVGVGKGAGAA